MMKRLLAAVALILCACDPGGPVDPAVQNEVLAVAAKPLCPMGYVRKGNKCIKAPLPEPTPLPVPEPTPVPEHAPAPVPIPEPAPQPAPEPTPTPQPTPVPAPEPAPVPQPTPQPESTLFPFTSIASEFDPFTTIAKSYIPGSNAADMVGAFRFMCAGGHLGRFDPLMYPGQDQAGHLHQFYGNLGITGKSTSDSIRRSGGSTCGDRKANPANRSAYWMPALLDGKGNVVQPDSVDLYYKRWPKSSTDCTSGLRVKACVGLPNALRFIWGYDMAAGRAAQYPFGFYCETVPGTFHTLAEAVANDRCPSKVYVRSDAPSCWDGKNLDSADHRSHLAYFEDSHLGYTRCPSTHPVHIPTLTLSVGYRIVAGDDTKLWRFSSDEMHADLPAGSTMHADYWEGWDPTVKKMWEDGCIDQLLNCNGGALGNGYSILDADEMTYYVNGAKVKSWTNPQHLVPVPSN